jgi:hypothetical protein
MDESLPNQILFAAFIKKGDGTEDEGGAIGVLENFKQMKFTEAQLEQAFIDGLGQE